MKVQFSYVREFDGIHYNPVACVAGVVDHHGHVHVGFSQCHPKDKFVKSRARDIALGRAIHGSNSTPAHRFVTYNNDTKKVYTDELIYSAMNRMRKELSQEFEQVVN